MNRIIINEVKSKVKAFSSRIFNNPLPFCLLILLSLLASCSEEDDTVEEFANWQKVNETYWNSLYAETQQRIEAGDASWKMIPNFSYNSDSSLSPEDYVIVHVLNEGTGAGTPLYTDTVLVHYAGRLLPSLTYTSGYQFDSSWVGDYNLSTMIPMKRCVGLTTTSSGTSSLVDGFTTALLNMHVGDRWEVYIPYQLAYGSTQSSSSDIPAYSTLIFDMTLVSYWHPGAIVPSFKAKQQ
ncbi:MAG: FKBP-type peptidyl-prolyl cis-trans isomerase [Prevotella sp.]|nr:FKBP-type peptidyl-prolyl cis-trans isomerase [Prevotella sp.]